MCSTFDRHGLSRLEPILVGLVDGGADTGCDRVQHRDVATKVIGDNCVGTGHRTFEGTVTGANGRVDGWVGAPGVAPAIGVRGAPLTVVGPNKFTVMLAGESVSYTRAPTPVHTPSRSPWWPWLLLLALAVVASMLTFASRRKRARERWI